MWMAGYSRYLFAIALGLASVLHAQKPIEFEPDEVIVRLHGAASVDEAQVLLGQGKYVVSRQLVRSLPIYLVKLTDGSGVPSALLDLKNDPDVRWAQANHLLELRATPNDPSFNSQWSMNQATDADVDAPEAWDVTPGGQDRGGDDIVAAVVDGGCLISHPDLATNLWNNPHETAANGIDDDNNGYIDDYYGWDCYNNDGTIPVSSHGTHVSGIVGARANNGAFVAGANWNVKLMIIAASSSNTAIVSTGYGYIIDQKRDWIETGGALGANVVVTNNSFGINYGDCTAGSYPIWNDLYDEMGSLGILSAAATANINVNVDAVGDVPTTCTSPYLIAVTNTTSIDKKNSGSAYGLLSIDLGAPGTAILSTTSDADTGYASGTSMASPLVAGAVALMHSAASADFYNLYSAHPDSGALVLKDLLLASVDVKDSLIPYTATGGRLNLFNSVQAISQFTAGGIHPNLRYSSHTIVDYPGGDQDGLLEGGEIAGLSVTLNNIGIAASNVWGHLTTTDSFVTILDDSASFGNIAGSSFGDNSADLFSVSADSATPLDHQAIVLLHLTADDYSIIRSIILVVGQKTIYWTDDVSNGEDGWTHEAVTPGYRDQWHISAEGYASPGYSWKCGDALDDNYADSLDAGLTSPYIQVTPESKLYFKHWIEAETSLSYPDSTYDGGIVEISRNQEPFAQVVPLQGYSRYFRYERGAEPFSGPLPGLACYCDYAEWIEREVDLADYAGDSIRVRFRFCSDNTVSREGWYIDDVYIAGLAPTPPVLDFQSYLIYDEPPADNDLLLDGGESATLTLFIDNSGNTASNVQGAISTTDPYLFLLDDFALFGSIAPSGSGNNLGDPFVIAADSATPLEHQAMIVLTLTAQNGYVTTDSFFITIGQRTVYWSDNLEAGENGWTHSNVLPGFADQWHLSTEQYTSADHAWKCGDTLDGSYNGLLDAGLVSPVIQITPQSRLRFLSWIDSEVSASSPDSAFDGGFVEISRSGSPFEQVTPQNGYAHTFHYLRDTLVYPGPQPGIACLSGQPDWSFREVDLSAYADEPIQIRFRFCSDDTIHAEGWYIDDLQIAGEPPPPPPAPLSISDLVISVLGDTVFTVKLTWSVPDTAVSHYVIYRSIEQDIDPDPSDSIGSTSDTTFVDPEIWTLPNGDYYYIVTGVRQ